MLKKSPPHRLQMGVFWGIFFSLLFGLSAEDAEKSDSVYFRFTPDSVHLEIDEEIQIKVELLDQEKKIRRTPFLLYIKGGQSAKAVGVTPRSTGEPGGEIIATLVALKPGSFQFAARTVGPRADRISGAMPVEVAFPALEKIEFAEGPRKLYKHTTAGYITRVYDASALIRETAKVTIRSENPEIASCDPFGNVTAHQPGKTALIAATGKISARYAIEVVNNPVERVELSRDVLEVRTGDVVKMKAVARTALGKPVDDAPITYALSAKPADSREPHAIGEVDEQGRFVAGKPGDYTILASCGNALDQVTIRVKPREVQKKVEIVGHGGPIDVYSSDLWVWEGVDGRDYAVTGTWEANGHALFWDVTDAANIKLIDTVAVDARTVNDVKVSADGGVAIISREGASNRKNGIVILDTSNPYEVRILAEYNDELTGGVHNLFIYGDYAYVVNNNTRYDIINIKDPSKPFREGRFELTSPGHSLHDVWIQDGIAYSSNWQDGLRLVDIGGLSGTNPLEGFIKGPDFEVPLPRGTPTQPIEFAHYEYPSGWNHAAFPYYSKSTGKFYVLAGDEAFPYGIGSLLKKKPEKAAGWIHFIDFSDLNNPVEVARYSVPEAGSHNYWIENDILYAAFYNGGLRVVDIAGELKGDLYAQGREIAWHLPMDPDGVVSNAPMVWGVQPHKGKIFFSDMNSGLWSAKLVDK